MRRRLKTQLRVRRGEQDKPGYLCAPLAKIGIT
jgi:hypothetical protein